jgi:hypothetical protein
VSALHVSRRLAWARLRSPRLPVTAALTGRLLLLLLACRRNDVWGARDAGVTAWLWGVDVVSFTQLADRLLSGGCLWGMREEEEGEG